MLSNKTTRVLYALLLILVSIVGYASFTKTNFSGLSLYESNTPLADQNTIPEELKEDFTNSSDSKDLSFEAPAAMMFTTIITNADETVGCSDNGFTIARYNLCGEFDDRTVTLSGSYSSYAWEQYTYTGTGAADINDSCPDTNNARWSEVDNDASFTIDASTINPTNGGEFRVRVNGGAYYYFKVKKSTITQTFVKRNFICDVPGRIQITNLSSAYEYAINPGTGYGAWQNSAIFDGLMPGNYVVKARLRNTPNTCEYPYEPIEIEEREIDIDVTYTDANCYGETGSITVQVNDVPGPYKYTLLDQNGVPQEFTTFIATNPYTFSAVGFGTYSVQVETQQCAGDPGNGIPAPRQTTDVNGNPITIGDGLVPLAASTEVNESLNAACGVNNVDIVVRTSGGAGPYTFTTSDGGNSGGSYATDTTYNVTTAGDYEFYITDSNGCTITATASVEELTPPDLTVSGTDGTCSNGGAKLNFSVSDSKGYNLSFRATPSDAWSPNPILSVAAGTYNTIQVRYQQGTVDCILNVPTSVTVTSVGTITGNAVKIADRTCDGVGGIDGGIIEFQGPFGGGSGSGYVFSISGDAPSNFSTQTTYSNLAPGTYTPIIRDGGGCRLELTPITILEVDPPTNIDFTQSNTNCAANTSDVQLTVTANAAIATFEVISPVTINNGASDTFIGLTNNTNYTFRITDVNGCQYEESYNPSVISSVRARVKSGGDLRVCSGAADGAGTFIVDGFTNNYTYNINSGAESAPQNASEVDITGLAAGSYTITVTDVDSGCTDTATLTVAEPASAINLNGTVTAMSCDNNNLGRVVANATGGWGSYSYTLDYPDGTTQAGPKTGTSFGNLGQEGTYTLTVADVEGCSDTFTFNLTRLDAPVIALDAATDYCYDPSSGATVVVTASGGTAGPPYTFRLDNGTPQASGTFTNVGSGNHTIEVEDANGCTDEVTVNIRPQLRVAANIVAEIPCGGADGEIEVRARNGYLSGSGIKAYEVSADNGTTWSAATPLTTNTFSYFTNVPGTYVFRVTDNQGCIATSSPVELAPPVNIDPAATEVFPASCGETNNGRVIITPDGTSGLPPYEVNFDGRGWDSQTAFSNLNAGQTYTFQVRDARGCLTVLDNVTIPTDATPAPDAAVSQVLATCTTGVVEGGISVTGVTGGVADFTYILQDEFGTELDVIGPTASTTETFTGFEPGNYRVITIDRNGCTDTDEVTVTQATLDVIPDPVPFPVCGPAGFSNTVEIVGGTGPFLIRLVGDTNPPVVPNVPPRRHTFNNLQYGVTYVVEVTDQGTGCIYEEEIPPITGPTALSVIANSTPGACDLNRNGEIQYTIDQFTVGDVLELELMNSDDGTVVNLGTITPGAVPYSDVIAELAGNYQLIVTNLTDNCNAAASVTIEENLPSYLILSEEPANCNALGQLTVQGYGGDGGPYEFAFMPDGVTPAAADYSNETTFVGAAGDYDVYVRDGSGCTSFDIATIIALRPDLPTPVINVVNQCDVTATSFEINVSVPTALADTPRFTMGGTTQIGVVNGSVYETTFFVNSPGNYTIDVQDADGCTSVGIAEVFDFLTVSGEFSTMPTCFDADGTITIDVTGGSDDFNFELQDGSGIYIGPTLTGDRTAGVFTGLVAGNYRVYILDNETGCSDTVNINLDIPTPPVLQPSIVQNISCNGANDGAIDMLIDPASAVDTPFTYNLYVAGTTTLVATNGSGVFNNLTPRFYDAVVVTARGCEDREDGIEIEEPPVFEIGASAPDFTCEVGANRFSSTLITVAVDPNGTGNIGTSGYQYSITGFSNYQTSNTFEIIDNGTIQTITVYAIDGNGCQDQVDVIIAPPTDVVPTITDTTALTCATDELVEITVTGTVNYEIEVTPAVPGSPFNSGGTATTTINLPQAGEYQFVVNDLSPNGCSYPLPKYTVVEPIVPTALISEAAPIRCDRDTNGALFIDVSNYTGNYSYEVFAVDGAGTQTSTGVTGNFNTADYPDVNGDAARISGLSGGNFVVRITSIDTPFCTAESNLATVRTPSGPLAVSTTEIGNVSCTDNTGSIEAIGTGGWDVAPYEYQLLLDDGSGTYPTVVIAYSGQQLFENLASGDYRVEIRDIEGCVSFDDITLNPITPITAGIREPSGLVCPGGNNAVLEAFDLSTGDATTATAGATGGVPGAGYKYQLIYLGSNNIADELSRSGLQDSPTFIGTNGEGYISAGWYAIEISSSYSCTGVTAPYYVNPPPAIIPSLVQVRAPGCGGLGQMRLTVTNPEAGFEYEYRSVNTPDPINDPYISMGVGITSVIIDGGPGFYQFDVRKVNLNNTCDPVASNGLTLVDAQDLDLQVNLPDDISCASETDGRIESFASGGVGSNEYFLYVGDPGDPFAPNATATLVRGPLTDGTFEGLPESADYYVAVTSGTTCFDVEGPFVITRPAPITFVSTTTNVSCSGEDDGSVTVEVTSGGEGLIQFALGPNFNEFFNDADTPGVYTFDELSGSPTGTEYVVLIQDSQGCSETEIVTIYAPEELQATAATTPETCLGVADGSAQLTITGGTPFVDALTGETYFEVAFNSNLEEDYVRNDSLLYENLLGGETYVFFIRDASGCETTVFAEIASGVDLVPTAEVVFGCEGIFPFSTVTIDLTDRSELSRTLFSLDVDDINLATDERIFGNLPEGEHTVYAYHENGCVTFVEFSVESYEPLTLTAEQTGPGEITAVATGGFGGYQFYFNGDSYGSENVFTINYDSNIEIRVVDANGCEALLLMPFDFEGMPEFPDFFTPNGDARNDNWFVKNADLFPNMEVKIFDRYGRVVAILTDVKGWDGTYEGSPLPTGDYWYVVNANDADKQQFVGHFTLYR